MNKNKGLLYACIAIFGIIGVYLTFFSGNINKYDSKTRASRIYVNESYDSDDGTTYYPTYYFNVAGKEYKCKSKMGSSSYPNSNKDIVYYDSNNPKKCMTEYEKSSEKVVGIICLIVTVVLIYLGIIKKPADTDEDINQSEVISKEEIQENIDKVEGIIAKVQLIFKRVVIGIIIVVLLVFTLIETVILKQTIISSGYPETFAEYVSKKPTTESDVFVDCIYTFTDVNENIQEIIVSIPKDDEPKQTIKIKYNQKNPQDYYNEGATLDKSGLIWYVVKVIAIILLTILFFNKNLLNKINISIRK